MDLRIPPTARGFKFFSFINRCFKRYHIWATRCDENSICSRKFRHHLLSGYSTSHIRQEKIIQKYIYSKTATVKHQTKNVFKWLKPGGKLMISDYCCKQGEWSQEFRNYVESRQYSLLDVTEYGNLIENAGFRKD